jgi:alcohol dehydrogenase
VIGFLWFDVAEGQDMAEMAAAGTLDLSVVQHHAYPLDEIEIALDAIENRHGGFTNVIVRHDH